MSKLEKTKGIVLKHIRYRESSIIVSIFTENFGQIKCIVNGVKTQNGKSRIALFQPLSRLELVVYYKNDASLLRLSEYKCSQPYFYINADPIRSAVALFITEILDKSLREGSEVQGLYPFLEDSLAALDSQDLVLRQFPVQFLIRLSKYLGFDASADLQWLELSPVSISPEMIGNFSNSAFNMPISMDHREKKSLLESLVLFYRQELGYLPPLRSLDIIRQVMD